MSKITEMCAGVLCVFCVVHVGNVKAESLDFTRKIPVAEPVDVLVCGGGPAGCAASVAAKRSGLKVLLVEGVSKLGGMATSGMVALVKAGTADPSLVHDYTSTDIDDYPRKGRRPDVGCYQHRYVKGLNLLIR